MLLTLTGIELFKIFKKWRTYIGFITIFVLVSLIEVSILIEGSNFLNSVTQNLQSTFVFVGNFLNGYLISYVVLGAITVHIPFLITLVAGELLAGEATAGTYRMLITRPVTRNQILTAKLIAGMIYTHMLVAFLALCSLGFGVALFGVGELIVIGNEITIFAQDDILWRFLLAYGIAGLSMSVVTSLAFLFSSLVENAVGPIISTMAVIIGFVILSAINIEFFQELRPFLFTTYMMSWRTAFSNPVDFEAFYTAVAVLLGHIVVLTGLTYFIFSKKDINS